MIAEALTAALICLDPGHGTPPAVGRQTEPIGPGSRIYKIKDGGGAPGEAAVALAIAKKTRALLLARGYRVAMTRTGPTFRYGTGGTSPAPSSATDATPRSCSESTLTARRALQPWHGDALPALHGGWTDDIYARSLRAAKLVQRATVRATGAADNGLVQRSDLTGFNWSNVPAILVETGFMTNPAERARLQSGSYQWKVARGFSAGVAAFTPPR